MITTREPANQKLHIVANTGLDIDLSVGPKMTAAEFWEFCKQNPEAVVERESDGQIVIMTPTTTETGGMNFNLSLAIGIWARRDGTGRCFDSSTGFTLPNGAVRSPDLSWIAFERWNSLSDDERSDFARICPDFVIELRSESDRLGRLQAKLAEYIENGARLGWLIDPIERRVHIYKPESDPEVLSDPKEIGGGSVLQDFVLQMKEIWG